MSLRRLASAIVPLALLAHTGVAAAESAPLPADNCDLQRLPLGVIETVPSACVLTVYDYTGDVPGLGWRAPSVPTVTAYSPDGAPVPAPIAVARSTTRLPVDAYTWCDFATCTNESLEGDLDGVRFDIVFLAPLPAGTVVDVRSDVGPGATVLIGEPAACPTPEVPLVSCALAACEGSCQPRQPPVLCDGGPEPAERDAGPGWPDDGEIPCGECETGGGLSGCSAGGGGAATPLVLFALGVAFVARRLRRRAGSPAAS
jgi:MYXO-CTERM domain-containing protein